MIRTLTLAAAVLAGCNAVHSTADQPSDVLFADSGWDVNQCLIRYAHRPKIKLCIQGNGSVQVAQTNTTIAINQWLAPLRAKYQGIADGVEFTCDQPYGTVNVSSGFIGSTGGPGFVNVGDQNELGSWLHEFGHAFACLGDTYVNGSAGYCMAGQPKSIMCYGLLLNQITDDDTAGALSQYQRLTFTAAELDPTGDEDGDGVPNKDDKCPKTPAGAHVWHEEQGGKWDGCAEGQTPSLF